jgi:hypothetical protein
MRDSTFSNLYTKFQELGITVNEVIPTPTGKYDGIVTYNYTNITTRISRLDKFYSNSKLSFKLHKDILKDTKRYKDTRYVVNKNGDVFSTIGAIKKIKPQIKHGCLYFNSSLSHKLIISNVVMESWGNVKPTEDSYIRHLNDNRMDCRLENLKWVSDIRDEYIDNLYKMGVVLTNCVKNETGSYMGTIQYLHTNIVKKINDIGDFYKNYKNNFKLNKDILKDTKQYKNTHIFSNKNGDIFSVNGLVKRLNNVSKNGYVDVRGIPAHHIVLESWGFHRPSNNHIVRHLNDIPSDNRLENLKWDFQIVNMKDKDVNEDKRKELLKRLLDANLFTLEEISILMKVKLESIEGIIKTF